MDEMEKAVDVAESNMARFGLTQQEVTSRKRWVSKTRQQVKISILLTLTNWSCTGLNLLVTFSRMIVNFTTEV